MRARGNVEVSRQTAAAERLRAYAASSSAVRKLALSHDDPGKCGGD